MAKVLFHVDPKKSMTEQDLPGHNRWHPDIPAEIGVKPGEDFRVECMEWTDGQIHNTDSPEDVATVDLSRTHMLSGPFAIKGAEPGDLLVVDILDIGSLEGWGYTGIFAKENGGGFLTDIFPEARKAIWDFHGIYATSRHLPGVKFAGISHPGLIGCAPSHALLEEWNKREQELVATDPNRVPPLGLLPLAENALLGTLKGAQRDRVAREAARTIPPREHGGNVDIKNLSRGTRIYFPVYVRDALLSVGDLHFSQGDGEITFCGAIEMSGWIDLGVDIIKDGMNRYGITSPLFQPGPVEPHYSQYLTFEGISVENGRNYYLDATIAYRQAALHAIDYLTNFGYTREQAYLLLGAAPIEGRIGGVVDIPNACVSLGIPLEIFEQDIRPR
ncbi:formamidase [Sulfobacillus thermosulfidooxidans]|uniref:formamidase n=1 Tax=Sulfobacillus thermosulfidooxidans TaxID=28034 RepID=UPI0006B62224|nr:formamidase [Sulfobacillus thermosulfidooxidans]